MRKSLILFSLLVFTAAGCHLLPGKKSEPAKTVLAEPGAQIVKKDRLLKGGKILVVPFSPGPAVAANDETDRTALMIVKSMAERLAEHQSRFDVLIDSNAKQAELVIKGRILQMKDPKGLRQKYLTKAPKVLEVKGEMIDLKTEETVLYFSFKKVGKDAQESFDGLAADIGQEIGEYVLSGGS